MLQGVVVVVVVVVVSRALRRATLRLKLHRRGEKGAMRAPRVHSKTTRVAPLLLTVLVLVLLLQRCEVTGVERAVVQDGDAVAPLAAPRGAREELGP